MNVLGVALVLGLVAGFAAPPVLAQIGNLTQDHTADQGGVAVEGVDLSPQSAQDPEGKPKATGAPRSILLRPLAGSANGDDAARSAADLDLPDFSQRPDVETSEAGIDEIDIDGIDEVRIDGLPADQPPASPPSSLSGEDIEILTLEPETAKLGILGADNGGFSEDFWVGANGKTVLRLLEIADPGLSRAAQSLARRMVLTAAPPPEDIGDGEFLAARLQLLARMGALDPLLELVNRAGARAPVPGAERIKLDALLLAEDFLGACSHASEQIGQQQDNYWLETITFCRALDGDRPGANLALELLQEQAVEAPVFYKLISALIQKSEDAEPPTIVSMADPDALVLSLARLLDVDMPDDIATGASALVITELATLPSIPLALRAGVAREAALRGGYAPRRLSQIYRAMLLTQEERSNATLLAETAEVVTRAEALLYQAALASPDETGRAMALVAGAKRARTDGTMGLYAAVNREALVTLPPSDDILPVAADLVRLMLLAGERNVAQAWYRHVRDMGVTGNGHARAALVAMWPLVVVGDGSGEVPVSGAILDLWWQSRTAAPEDKSALQAQLMYGLFDALGHDIPDAFWPEIMGSGETVTGPMATPSLPVWRGLLKAEAEGNRGGVALHALAALSAANPGELAPQVVTSIVHALTAVGLEREARAIALEAMVAHGL